MSEKDLLMLLAFFNMGGAVIAAGALLLQRYRAGQMAAARAVTPAF